MPAATLRRLPLVLGALTAMGPLAIDTYLPALPAITREFDTTGPVVQLSLSLYFVGVALGQALYGPWSDRHGRKPPLYAGLMLFIAGSIGCAVAPTVEILIVCRFLQALGGCAPLVIPRAVVRDLFDQRDSVRILSMLVLVMGVAPILAPLAGGQMLRFFGWRSIFWAFAAYGVIVLTVSAVLLPDSLPADRRVRQPVGAVLGTYRRLLGERRFMGYVLAGGGVFGGLLGYIAASPYVFIELYGVSPQRFGLFFGANAVGIITASQINRWLSTRTDASRILGIALAVVLLASATLAFLAITGLGGFAGLLIPLFVFIAMHGFVSPNSTALAMAPQGAVAGAASALLGTVQFIMGASAGSLIAAFADGTARPFAIVIALCGTLAFVMFRFTRRGA